MSKITDLYAQLLHQAAVTGRDQHKLLTGGARLSVRHDGAQITLTIARTPQRVGDREIVIFRCDCCVPSTARRIPAIDQKQRERDGKMWWTVAYQWAAPEAAVFDDDEIVADAARAVEEGGYGYEESAL